MPENPRQKRILMCAPDHFAVAYVINPWMEGHYAQTDADIALEQWTRLKAIIEQHAEVSLQPPRDGLPDLVFTANAGLVRGGKAVVSRFRTYDVKLTGALQDYAERIWTLPAVVEWREAALAEREEIEELEVEF